MGGNALNGFSRAIQARQQYHLLEAGRFAGMGSHTAPREIMSSARGTAPAFQFYAADHQTNRTFKLMKLDERGLYLSMLCECWINGNVPSDLVELALVLGKPEAELKAALTTRVLKFFDEHEGNLVSPDLEKYRTHVLEQRRRMSEGGSKGGKKRAQNQREGSSTLSSLDQATPKGRENESGHESESVRENESIESGGNHLNNDEWINDYEKASRGN